MARLTKTRKTNPTVLVIVEGETEQVYFSQLRGYERLAGITVIPKMAKRSSPYYVVKQAIEAINDEAFDMIWCVFDRDVLSNTKPADFDEIYREAKRKDIRFAESLPCFEVWFLMHFVIPSKYYSNAHAVESELCQHIKGYCKETEWLRRSELYAILKQYQLTAISNSKTVSATNRMSPDPNATFSDVVTLIESILK